MLCVSTKLEVLFEDLAEVLVVDLLEAWAHSESRILHELSQFVIERGQSTGLPHFLNLVEGQITVTVLIVQVQIVEIVGLFATHDALEAGEHALCRQLVVQHEVADVLFTALDQRLSIRAVILLLDFFACIVVVLF